MIQLGPYVIHWDGLCWHLSKLVKSKSGKVRPRGTTYHPTLAQLADWLVEQSQGDLSREIPVTTILQLASAVSERLEAMNGSRICERCGHTTGERWPPERGKPAPAEDAAA